MDDRFLQIEKVVRIRNADLSYLIVHQHRGHHDDERIQRLKARLAKRGDIKIVDSLEAGLSKSRNLAIAEATGEIVLIADDDIEYREAFFTTVISAFAQHDYDLISFRVDTPSGSRPVDRSDSIRAHGPVSILGAASVEIAFRLSAIRKLQLRFDEDFGLGARYPISEEAIFLRDCQNKGVRLATSPQLIAWHEGMSSGENWANKEVWFSKGAVFRRMYGISGLLVLTALATIKHRLYKRHFSFAAFLGNNLKSFLAYRAKRTFRSSIT